MLLGLLVAAVTARLSWQVTDPALALPWFVLAAVLGFALASAAFLIPAWREATRSTVAASRSEFGPRREPLWQRVYLDLLLAIGAAVFWNVAQTGHHIVRVTEGVAQTSVRYEAFLGPLFLWLGAGLLWTRLAGFALRRGMAGLARQVPAAGDMAPLIAASLARQHHRIAGATVLVSLAFAFATATPIFNTTYDMQSRVDAELTNGADVAVTGTTAMPAAALLAALRALPGVVEAEPLMHRLAYVGSDLQDMFGVDAQGIGQVTTLSNAYFANHDATEGVPLPASRVSQEGEGCAGIEQVHEVEPRRQCHAAPEWQRCCHEGLDALVQHEVCSQQKARAPAIARTERP